MLVQLHRMKTFWERYAPLIVFLAVALMFVLLAPSIGFAAADPVTPVGVDTTVNVDLGVVELDAWMVQLVSGVLIPFLIAFISRATTPAWIQKTATIVLSAITGLVTVGLNDAGGAVISVEAIKAAAQTAVIAIASYFLTVRNSKTEAKLTAVGPDLLPGS